jgi:tellurite resistance protein
MSHFPPPPKVPPKVGLFRRVPPAIFPALLGLLGLVAVWRRASEVFGVPQALVDLAAGMVTLLFLYCIVAYGAKFMFRPSVVSEDLKTLPGRTGLAALFIGLMVEAAVLAPMAPAIATSMLGLGALGLLGIALHVLPQRLKGADSAGPITPAMHLVFVGFILIPGAAIPLRVAEGLLPWVIWYCALAAIPITALSIRPLLTGEGQPPLRPLQVIHLAPAGFVATGAFMTNQPVLGVVSLVWAMVLAAIYLMRLRWLTQGEFSGFWSAFTFPVTAFVGALLAASQVLEMEALGYLGGVILVAATLYIPAIAYRVLKLWAKGVLAAKTNAAIA